MILTGPEIERRYRAGSIEINPFDKSQLNPASYDLRLGRQIAVYGMQHDRSRVPNRGFLDSKVEPQFKLHEIPEGGVALSPNKLYLMHTEEVVCAHDCVPAISGKSSIGRLGISVHITAGFGEPGFRGQWTLEVTVVHPVIVYAGMRICQIFFQTAEGEIQKYDGNYQGETSMGPVASRSWKQFDR